MASATEVLRTKEYPEELVTEIRAEFEGKMNSQLDIIKKENQKAIEGAIAEMRKKIEPPKPDELQAILDQEYIEFKVKVHASGDERTFTIRELPQAIERKILKEIKKQAIPLAIELQGVSFTTLLDGDPIKKIADLLNAFDPVLGMFCEMAATILNPFGKDDEVNAEWVQKNLSSQRILAIIAAQFECNKVRDFFSLLSRGTNYVG